MSENKSINETTVKTDLALLKETFDKVGISYTMRQHHESGIEIMLIGDEPELITGDLLSVQLSHNSIEFENEEMIGHCL